MAKPNLSDLNAFAKIAAHRSFRKAADELGFAPSTLSHMMRTLERNIGVRLLHRTTRSVSTTDAGTRLLSRLRPVLVAFETALEELDDFRDHPSGTLRINTTETAARILLRDVVPLFLQRYPDVTLDLVTENKLVDIVADGFDAGIRLGSAVPQDMIAVRFGGEFRFLAVASPDYLAARGAPGSPDDLMHHTCIRIRMPSGKLFRWEFLKHGQELTVDVPGPIILDNVELMAMMAMKGLGIAYISNKTVDPYIAEGRLVALLEDWCQPLPGLFLYYPGHRHVPASLKAFIEVLREILS